MISNEVLTFVGVALLIASVCGWVFAPQRVREIAFGIVIASVSMSAVSFMLLMGIMSAAGQFSYGGLYLN